MWLITGASQGLGRAILENVLDGGDRAVATSRNLSLLAPLQMKFTPEQLLVLRMDVTNRQDIADAFKKTEEHFNRLDIVVNNAGYGLNGEIEGTSDDDARAEMEILFWGPVSVTKQAIRFFREVNPPGHGGRIFNMSSIAGFVGHPGISIYGASKFALDGFTESFAREMPPEWNIKGVVLIPGGFETNARQNAVYTPMHPAYSSESPSRVYINALATLPFVGDPKKAAKVIFDLAGHPNPPMRLALGSPSVDLMLDKMKRTIAETEEWSAISRSMNRDDYKTDISQTEGL